MTGRTASKTRTAGRSGSRRSVRARAQAEAYIALVKAAGEMTREFVELLKADDLSLAQYNVLRILRGAGEPGLSCGEIAGRLIQHDPDITRLLDRLERRQLVARSRDAGDRRVVRTRITPLGLDLLARLDAPVDALHDRQLGHMSEARLRELSTVVHEARKRR